MRQPNNAKNKSVRQTLLIVGEGDAEVIFVRHVKAVCAESVGRSVQTINAHGKGGMHVLQKAINHMKNRDYDKVVLLLDTDIDWSNAERAKAAKKRIGVIESTPCLEAWLLQIAGVQVEGDTRVCKRAFHGQFGCEAHQDGYMEKHFSREILDKARDQVPQLNELMNHMGIAKQ